MFNKLAICQWCIPAKGPSALQLAADLHYNGVEMDMGLNDPARDLRNPAILKSFLEAKRQAGIETPSLTLNYLKLNSRAAQPQAKAILDQAIAVAVQLEASTLQMCSFWGDGMNNREEFQATVELLQYTCQQAAPHGITVASENLLDAEGNLQLMKAVNAPNFAIYFDTANPYLFADYDGMAMLRTLYPHIREMHIKDYQLGDPAKCTPLGQGDCFAQAALNLLKENSYPHWLVTENELDATALVQDAAWVRNTL